MPGTEGSLRRRNRRHCAHAGERLPPSQGTIPRLSLIVCERPPPGAPAAGPHRPPSNRFEFMPTLRYRYDPMAQQDQALVGSIIKSINKKVEWEFISAQAEGARVTLRLGQHEAQIDVSREEIVNAETPGAERSRLREKLKRAHRRLFTPRVPYMPWKLPKIEPVGAMTRNFGGGGGFSRPRR